MLRRGGGAGAHARAALGGAPGNDIGAAGTAAISKALTINNTVTTIDLEMRAAVALERNVLPCMQRLLARCRFADYASKDSVRVT